MHIFTFGGLSYGSADYTPVGWFRSSRAGMGMVSSYSPTRHIRVVLVRSTLQG